MHGADRWQRHSFMIGRCATAFMIGRCFKVSVLTVGANRLACVAVLSHEDQNRNKQIESRRAPALREEPSPYYTVSSHRKQDEPDTRRCLHPGLCHAHDLLCDLPKLSRSTPE